MAMVLALRLLLADPGVCYFVGNTRILAMPTCDVSSATIEMLTEQQAPAGNATLARQRRFAPRSAPPNWSGCTTVVRGNEELERRLELEEQERITAASERAAAEQERDEALRQRDRALMELERVRRELATALGHRSHIGPRGK